MAQEPGSGAARLPGATRPLSDGSQAALDGPAGALPDPVQPEARRRIRSDSLAAVGFLGPSAILLLIFLAYPILETFRMSVFRVDQFGRSNGFVGLGNYRRLFADTAFQGSLGRTIVWTAAVVGVTTIISLFTAWVLARPFRGRGIFRALLLLPWAAPLVIASMLARWMLHPDFGAASQMTNWLGLTEGRVEWLARPATSFPIMIAIAIWVSIPSVTLILLAGMQGVDTDLYEAAALDGAREWRTFWDMTLPLIRPVLAVSILLNVIFVFNSFPIIWVLTEGGPAGSTDTLVTYLYKIGFRLYDMGLAAAVSVVMFAMLLVFAILHTKVTWRNVAQ